MAGQTYLMLDALRGLRYAAQGEFGRSLQGVPPEGTASEGDWLGWQPWVYYRLGMYATVAALHLKSSDWRFMLPTIVSLAACGDHARARKALADARYDAAPARLRVALADALAPFMPVEALEVLESVGVKAPATLTAGLLLRLGHDLQALEVLDAALKGANALHLPELYLYQTMAQTCAPQVQLERLNRFLAAHQLPSLKLRWEEVPPGPCNLALAKPLPLVDGPLVSVLMTTYRTGERASVAIESLLQQTYRNLEIIVVDDASGDGTPELVESWARKDTRVKLVRLGTNGGTYLAKSMGLRMAKGEFVTCHDSDDWSHPLKIERQMQPLLEDAGLVATTSHWVRMQDDGVFYARPVHPLMRLNPSSPLFRKSLVLEHAGAWDCVRTGADSEFLARLRLVFGKRAIKRIAQPLALGSHRAGSLMTADDTGYTNSGISPQRLDYWESWSRWHLDCLRQGAVPRMLEQFLDGALPRPFAAPSEILVAPEAVQAALMQSAAASLQDNGA